jgi:uncharacterized lipoprotein YehR (DUF1307 family)
MEAVIVAVITAIGGVLAVLVQKSREENKEDHGKVMEKLIDLHKDVHHVETKIDHVEEKLDSHISLDHPTTKTKSKKK